MIAAVSVDRVDPPIHAAAPPALPFHALDLDAEVELDPAISAEHARPGPGPPGAFLVTGGTGFLGAHLVSGLLERPAAEVAEVICLVRADSEAAARARLLDALRAHQMKAPEDPARLVAVPADLSRPGLGLAAGRFEELAERAGAIIHSAAFVNFVLPYKWHKAANVGATRELVRMAVTGPLKPLHHLSTAAIFRSDGGPRVVEVGEDDSIHPFGAGLSHGYPQSKWVAERVVELARGRGVPASIYRLGYVSGHSATGVSSLDDARALLLRWCVEHRLAPDLRQPVEMTPVDFAVAAILHLARQPVPRHRAYHVVNRRGMDWGEVLSALSSLGFPVDRVPYSRWLEEVGRPPPGQRTAEASALLLRERGMHQWLAGQRLELRTERLDEALRGSGLSCPPFDAALLERYVAYWVDSGFWRRPR